MANPQQLSRPLAAALAAFGLLMAPAALAQSAAGTDPARTPRVDAAEGFGSSDASGGIFGESASPFDLIHRAVLMNERSATDFSRQHQGRMSDEAFKYRTLQREALQRQAQPAAVPAADEE